MLLDGWNSSFFFLTNRIKIVDRKSSRGKRDNINGKRIDRMERGKNNIIKRLKKVTFFKLKVEFVCFDAFHVGLL